MAKKAQELFYKTCAFFTLILLVFTLIMYTGSNSQTVEFFATKATTIFSVLLFSFILALSEILIGFWKAGGVAKRLTHFFTGFIGLWVCFFLIPGKVKMVRDFIIIAFFFMLLYLLLVGLAALVKRIGQALEKN